MKISELIELFKKESCKNKIDYSFVKVDTPDDSCYYSLVIYYYTNLWSIEHKKPNELEIVLDENLQVMGIEFESEGDRVSRTPAWKRLCKTVADDETYIIDVDYKDEY